MQRRRASLSLLFVVLSCAAMCLAQTRRPGTDSNSSLTGSMQVFSIRGTVRVASTEATPEMIRVDLVHSFGDLVATAFTRGNGDFEFSGIAAGNYSLVVDMRGYEPVRENVQLNGNRWGVALYLKEIPRVAPTETGNKVSERELTLPRKAHNAYRKGMHKLYEDKNPLASLSQFQSAIEEFPGYYEAYQQMGLARLYLGQQEEAEAAFRTSKSDLKLRPIFHRKTERIDAHILVCFLSLAMWRTLEMWMKGKGLGTCARQLIGEIATIKSMDLVLPVRTEGEQMELRLRVVSKPDRMVAELLQRLGLQLPMRSKLIENVVEKTGV